MNYAHKGPVFSRRVQLEKRPVSAAFRDGLAPFSSPRRANGDQAKARAHWRLVMARLRAFLAAGLFAFLATAGGAAAQDMTSPAFWEDVDKRIKDQQAEEARQNQELARQTAETVAEQQQARASRTEYAPNTFVSFPPEAWLSYVKEEQSKHNQAVEERFGQDPAYRALLRGVWTYGASPPSQKLKSCTATFWTQHGGVSFIHLGGPDEFTLLGFFGASIPAVKSPRVVRLDLIQSGETQSVQVYNINFDASKKMGMVLFNVRTPAILLSSIDDRQAFEIKLNRQTIAQGEWHSGLKARDQLAACLRKQSDRSGD